MRKSYFLSLAVLLLMVIFAMVMSGCVLCFVDIGSLLMVVIPTFFMLIASYSLSEIGRNFSMGFSKGSPRPEELKTAIIFFKSMQKYLAISGALGFFTGLIAMLAMLGDPDHIGSGMALALITVLYALILTMAIALPFRTGLEKKLAETG